MKRKGTSFSLLTYGILAIIIIAVLLAMVFLFGGQKEREKADCSGLLSNPNATAEASSLMKYLCDTKGESILSGQYAEGIDAPEIRAIYHQTGKYPAIMGFDFLYYGKTASENVSFPVNTTRLAIDWWNCGGIVAFCWHWMAPTDNRLTQAWPWNKSFYTQATNFDLAKALQDPESEEYKLLMADIETVCVELGKLKKAGVPVLWSPLHEASGGWFWWGAQGSEAYKQLWNLLYDTMVNKHGLDNLIWVWSGPCNAETDVTPWYPGDARVDIIAASIYGERHDYTSKAGHYESAQACTGEDKLITISETSVIPDPDALSPEGMWSWFALWYREFVVDLSAGYENALYSDEYTSLNMLRKAYGHEKVITLDELPKLNPRATYPKEEGDADFISRELLLITTIFFGVLATTFYILYAEKYRSKRDEHGAGKPKA